MRVLWFTNTPSLFKCNASSNRGGGWIESLEFELRKVQNVELGVSFFYNSDNIKKVQNAVTYYPIAPKKGFLKRVIYSLWPKKGEKRELREFLHVVNDFKPDLIHVFGSEKAFGLIGQECNVPTVLHLQGVLNPYLISWFPPGYSLLGLLLNKRVFKNLSKVRDFHFFSSNAERERTIFKGIQHYMGRTSWDKGVIKVFNPNAKYYYVGELLRDVFYQASPWTIKRRSKIVFSTTISNPIYKGVDLILKTAKILSKLYINTFDFEWNVYGNVDLRLAETITGISANDVKVRCLGVVSAEVLIEKLQNTDIFIHSSYIDNSPNSVCEAQLLGLPVISTNVGGVSSLINDGETGVLVPANDPYYLSSCIIDLLSDDPLRVSLGNNAREVALRRHDKVLVLEQLLSVYESVCK
jgi:glycosyltransferase involved in cell wall biosynthesis